jgi:murein DD-endopeptidase MepM/ murein hydrolase activator NlpD
VLTPDCYRPLLIEGLQQSRDTRLPLVSVHRQFRVLVEDLLDEWTAPATRVVAQPGHAQRMHTIIQDAGHSRVLLAVGPEGGWNDFELSLLESRGFTPISMGMRALRSDTACVALLTLAHDALEARTQRMNTTVSPRFMKPLLRAVLVVVAAVVGITAQQPPHTLAPLTVRVATRARAVRQGEVVLVTVTPSRDAAIVEGGAFATPIQFWRSGERMWQGLVAIPLDTETGRRDLVVRATTADNVTTLARVEMQVARAKFPERRLTVDERFVDPPESEVTRILAESKRLDGLFAAIRPGRLWTGAWRMPVPGTGHEQLRSPDDSQRRYPRPSPGSGFPRRRGTPIQAPNAGEVVLAEDLYFSGNTVVLDHGAGLYSLFAHLSKTNVGLGSRVARGDVLGEVGAPGASPVPICTGPCGCRTRASIRCLSWRPSPRPIARPRVRKRAP